HAYRPRLSPQGRFPAVVGNMSPRHGRGRSWISGATKRYGRRIEPIKKIARTLRKHRALILNYFKAKKEFSSGVVEGLNNKAKVTMRKSYGLRTFRILELALYHALGKLPSVNFTMNYSDESIFFGHYKFFS